MEQLHTSLMLDLHQSIYWKVKFVIYWHNETNSITQIVALFIFEYTVAISHQYWRNFLLARIAEVASGEIVLVCIGLISWWWLVKGKSGVCSLMVKGATFIDRITFAWNILLEYIKIHLRSTLHSQSLLFFLTSVVDLHSLDCDAGNAN